MAAARTCVPARPCEVPRRGRGLRSHSQTPSAGRGGTSHAWISLRNKQVNKQTNKQTNKRKRLMPSGEHCKLESTAEIGSWQELHSCASAQEEINYDDSSAEVDNPASQEKPRSQSSKRPWPISRMSPALSTDALGDDLLRKAHKMKRQTPAE